MSTMITRGNVVGLCTVNLTTIIPALVGPDTIVEQLFTVPGIRFTDVAVGVTTPPMAVGLAIGSVRVTADDQIAIAFSNNTAAGATPVAATGTAPYRVTIARLDSQTTAFQG